jgi:hypothetical protein
VNRWRHSSRSPHAVLPRLSGLPFILNYTLNSFQSVRWISSCTAIPTSQEIEDSILDRPSDTYIGIAKMLLGQLHVQGTSRPRRSYPPIAAIAPNSTFLRKNELHDWSPEIQLPSSGRLTQVPAFSVRLNDRKNRPACSTQMPPPNTSAFQTYIWSPGGRSLLLQRSRATCERLRARGDDAASAIEMPP